MAKVSKSVSGKLRARVAAPGMPRVHNCIPSRDPDRDWDIRHATEAHVHRPAPRLPAAVDLRAKWWSVGNQLNSGACVGFASAEGVVRHHLVKHGRLRRDVRLSPRFVWMAAKESDEFVSRPTTFIENYPQPQ